MNLPLFLAACLVLLLPGPDPLRAEPAAPIPEPSLEIQIDGQGIAHVHAVIILPGRIMAVHAILTDYEHWPLLFPPGLRMISIRRDADRVLTELVVPHYVLPGELRLVVETREAEPGRIETNLVGGDFDRYRRVWKLTGIEGGRRTRAELELDLQPKRWTPGWVFKFALRQELREHLNRLRGEVQAREHP